MEVYNIEYLACMVDEWMNDSGCDFETVIKAIENEFYIKFEPEEIAKIENVLMYEVIPYEN